MSGYLIDTHVWFWVLGALEQQIREEDRVLLEGAASRGELFLSAMSIWETAQKEASGRLGVSLDALMEESFSDDSLHLLDVTVPILIAANRLPGEIHGDPVDRILAASAREFGMTLVTRDTELRRYAKQGHLKVHKV